MSIMQEPESTGDIIDDVHAQEEHAKAIASTAEVSVLIFTDVSTTSMSAGVLGSS